MADTICYTWDRHTKEYKHQDVCQRDPLDGGVLLPMNSTYKKPPVREEGKAIVWEGDDWVIKNDYRGESAFNGVDIVSINFIVDLPNGWSFELPKG